MDPTQEAVQVLRRAEQSLRELLAKTATSGRYDELMRLGDLAKEVATLARRAEDFASQNGAALLPDPPHSTKPIADTAGNPRRGQTGVNKRGYPRFVRDGETIIKIGWSKTAKAEYEQKAPRRVLTDLVSALAKLATTKKRVTMEQVLPLHDSATGSEVPAYQVYICLAWLRSVGTITQHGRQGYSLAKRDGIEVQANEFWRQLATR
jgi:hypothetical protein